MQPTSDRRPTLQSNVEMLQRILHNFHDMAAQVNQPFVGIVIRDIDLHYRDAEPSVWTVRFEPQEPQPLNPLTAGEDISAQDQDEGAEDEAVRAGADD